jgi:hypothetical protein
MWADLLFDLPAKIGILRSLPPRVNDQLYGAEKGSCQNDPDGHYSTANYALSHLNKSSFWHFLEFPQNRIPPKKYPHSHEI